MSQTHLGTGTEGRGGDAAGAWGAGSVIVGASLSPPVKNIPATGPACDLVFLEEAAARDFIFTLLGQNSPR